MTCHEDRIVAETKNKTTKNLFEHPPQSWNDFFSEEGGTDEEKEEMVAAVSFVFHSLVIGLSKG